METLKDLLDFVKRKNISPDTPLLIELNDGGFAKPVKSIEFALPSNVIVFHSP